MNTKIILGDQIDSLKRTLINILKNGQVNCGLSDIEFRELHNISQGAEFKQHGFSIETIKKILTLFSKCKNLQNFTDLKKATENEIATQSAEIIVDTILINYNITNNNGKIQALCTRELNTDEKNTIRTEITKIIEQNRSVSEFISLDKENQKKIWISPEIIDDCIQLFKNLNFNLQIVNKKTIPEINPIQIGKIEDTKWGKKIIFYHNKNDEMWHKTILELKSLDLWQKTIGYQTNELGHHVYMLSVDIHQKANIYKTLEILAKSLNVSVLKLKIEEYWAETKARTNNETDCLQYIDVEHTNHIKIKIIKKISDDEFSLIKETIYYNFPDNHSYNKTTKIFTIGGIYQQYVYLGRTLKDHGYNVENLKQLLLKKIKEGSLKKELIDGDGHDSFYAIIEKETNKIIKKFETIEEAKSYYESMDKEKYDLFYIPKMSEELDTILSKKDKDIELYQEQKDGIEFLFYRKCAILGDETGLGKTIQLIGAAEVKMQDDSYDGSTLILALNPLTAQQWADEIVRIIGEENSHLVSTSCTDLKRWTILTYNFFSYNYNEIEKCIRGIQGHNFKIVILDELHKIKHQKTQRSQRLAAALKNIPIKWGATATISANKPMDVRNQLIILNHSLGRMSPSKFKKEFCGMVFKNGKWKEGEEEDRLAAAEKLNKWLHLTGVYIRRNKSDVRQMPNLSIRRDDVPIDIDTYEERTKKRIEIYAKRARESGKNVEDAEHLKIMIARRTELSIAKVPQTINKAKELLIQNKRIIVFTAFKEAAELLKPQLERIIKNINPKYNLLTYISSTSKTDRANVKQKFNNDPNYRILLMSLKMGSTGIDFPNAATEMIINDYDWTPEQAEQSEGRIYRINTNNDVNIHYMIAHGTYDEVLYDKVQLKRRIAARIQRAREEYRKEKNVSDSKEKLKELVNLKKALLDIDKQINATIQGEENKTLEEM